MLILLIEHDVQLHVAKASHIKHCFAKLPLSLAKQWKKEDSSQICPAREGFSFVQEENLLTDSSLWIVDSSVKGMKVVKAECYFLLFLLIVAFIVIHLKSLHFSWSEMAA